MYKLLSTGAVQRLKDGAIIPDNARNRDFIEYQKWLLAGNTPQPADVVVVDESERKKSERKAADDRLKNDYLLNALVKTVAARLGIPAAQLITEIKANV